jgi:hypothetical protein
MPFVAALIAVVTLAAPFGEASGSAVDVSDGLTIEITVVYEEDASAVIVRPYSDFQELPPTAMALQPDGSWLAWVQLPTAQNWQIAFEGFLVDGGSDLSDGTDLLELGVDPVVIESEVLEPLPAKPLIPSGSWWLIIAIGVGLLALAALAYWAFVDTAEVEEDPEAVDAGADPQQPSDRATEPT